MGFNSGLKWLKITSGFRREVDENCTLLGYYTARSGNSLPTFRDNPSVPFSRVKNPKMSVRNYHYLLRNNPEDRTSHPTELKMSMYVSTTLRGNRGIPPRILKLVTR
jgi:hypothetical protein